MEKGSQAIQDSLSDRLLGGPIVDIGPGILLVRDFITEKATDSKDIVSARGI